MKIQLPNLSYSYDALEPFIDATTMEIHHSKHHQGYVDKFIAAIEGTPLEEMELEQILSDPDSVDEKIKNAVLNNGGGVYNHNLFWEMMGPSQTGTPEEKTAKIIDSTFGTFETFKEEFAKSALSLFGSGWTWLVLDKNDSALIVNTFNQGTPLAKGLKPILGLDVWEHAYYLKYQNRRAEYIGNWWNVVNWPKIEENLA